MHLEKDKFFTIEEFEKLQYKYKYNIEFINGDVILHSKTSVKHNEIVNNINSSFFIIYIKLKLYIIWFKYNNYS